MPLLADLSNNNPSPIDFAALRKHGIYGVWLKVSEGMHYTDPTFSARSRAARAARLHVGGYHFARPKKGHPETEAEYFCARLGKVQRRDLHPVLDLEANDEHLTPTELHDWARRFLLRVHKLTGVKALTYSGPGFVLPQNWQHTFGTGAGLWVAAYGPNDGQVHPVAAPRPWHRYVAHQYTSVGQVHGVHGHVDLSIASRRRSVLAHGLRGLPQPVHRLGAIWPDADRRDSALLRILARIHAGRVRQNGTRAGHSYYLAASRLEISDRERAVLEAMSHGLGRKGTADVLGVSEDAVADTLKRARPLLRAKDTTHAVANALRLGIIP